MASKPASQPVLPEDPPEKVLPASQSLESLPLKIAVLQGHKTTPRCPGGSRKLSPHRGQVKVTGMPDSMRSRAARTPSWVARQEATPSGVRPAGALVQSWHAPQ
jgi:hypothetical protein